MATRLRHLFVPAAVPHTICRRPVAAVFDNLLPDSADIRRRVAERTGAAGTDAYSLLEWSREKTNLPFSRDVIDAIEKHRKTLAI